MKSASAILPRCRRNDQIHQESREARMKLRVHVAAAAILAAGLVASHAQTSGTAPRKHAAAVKAKTPPGPTVQEQIDSMKQQFQGEIDSLRTDLATKDEQLKQAQQAAADAQAAAAKAQAAVDSQQQAFTTNNAAVADLQSNVSDLKLNQLSLVTTVSDETSNLKKAIANPDVLNFKGITISPTGSFLAAETVWRQGATGGDINTSFTGVPLANSQAAEL